MSNKHNEAIENSSDILDSHNYSLPAVLRNSSYSVVIQAKRLDTFYFVAVTHFFAVIDR